MGYIFGYRQYDLGLAQKLVLTPNTGQYRASTAGEHAAGEQADQCWWTMGWNVAASISALWDGRCVKIEVPKSTHNFWFLGSEPLLFGGAVGFDPYQDESEDPNTPMWFLKWMQVRSNWIEWLYIQSFHVQLVWTVYHTNWKQVFEQLRCKTAGSSWKCEGFSAGWVKVQTTQSRIC